MRIIDKRPRGHLLIFAFLWALNNKIILLGAELQAPDVQEQDGIVTRRGDVYYNNVPHNSLFIVIIHTTTTSLGRICITCSLPRIFHCYSGGGKSMYKR